MTSPPSSPATPSPPASGEGADAEAAAAPSTTPECGDLQPTAEQAQRSAQTTLAVLLVVVLGLLLYRGYGHRLGARPTESVTAARVDLNRADRTELEQVPGVGPKMAQAIDEHRKGNGPFLSVEQLQDVRGVGPATLDKVRPYLRVEAVPPSAETPPDPDPPILERKRPAPRAESKGGTSPSFPPSKGRKLQPGDPPINVNTASVEDLQRIPGIGPITAQNIATARAASPFRSLTDLDRVKGIGAKTLEKLRPFVVVE